MKIKTILVDDIKLHRDMLAYLMRENFPALEIIGESGSVAEAYTMIRERKPDLLLLDIQLADGSAFDLLDRVGSIQTKVIFISAYEKYALKAIQFEAFDYLLKPISIPAFKRSVNKVIHFFETMPSHASTLESALPEEHVIPLSTTKGVIFVNEQEIIYLKAIGKYTEIVTSSETYTSSKNLKVFENLLDEQHFFRVHHAYLINQHHIGKFEKQCNTLTMKNEQEIPVSHRKKEQFVKRLQHLL